MLGQVAKEEVIESDNKYNKNQSCQKTVKYNKQHQGKRKTTTLGRWFVYTAPSSHTSERIAKGGGEPEGPPCWGCSTTVGLPPRRPSPSHRPPSHHVPQLVNALARFLDKVLSRWFQWQADSPWHSNEWKIEPKPCSHVQWLNLCKREYCSGTNPHFPCFGVEMIAGAVHLAFHVLVHQTECMKGLHVWTADFFACVKSSFGTHCLGIFVAGCLLFASLYSFHIRISSCIALKQLAVFKFWLWWRPSLFQVSSFTYTDLESLRSTEWSTIKKRIQHVMMTIAQFHM